MDLFEIVSSFIPDEQKADIKAKIDGELAGITKKSETAVKKDLSKRYGVNFFEDDVSKAFTDTLFVRKETYEATLGDLESHKKKLTNYEKEIDGYKQEKSLFTIKEKLSKAGFNTERFEAVKPLLKESKENETDDEKVERIKSLVPELFVPSKARKEYFGNDNSDDKGLTEADNYFAQYK